MGARTVEVIAPGPAPTDPYSPLAGTWAIAAAFVARGDSVRVLYPKGPVPGTPTPGIAEQAIPLPLRRPGAASEEAEFASRVGHVLRPGTDLVLRDPVGLGTLGVRGQARSPRLVGIVRTVELAAFDRERAGRAGAGWVDRFDGWRDRRAVRRLEQAALEEADLLLCDAPDLAVALTDEYHLPRERIQPALPPVPYLGTQPPRDGARGTLGIPTDVPVVVAPAQSASAEESGVDRVLEAFRRVRPFFPGIRLIVVGAPAPSDAGVVALPGRESLDFATGLAAADVTLVVPRRRGFDPGAVLSLRAGCATIVADSVAWPSPPGGAVRTVASDDAGELASALAELVADPGAARELVLKGREAELGYRPEELLRRIDRAAPLAPSPA